jgi:hypothetical protein
MKIRCPNDATHIEFDEAKLPVEVWKGQTPLSQIDCDEYHIPYQLKS